MPIQPSPFMRFFTRSRRRPFLAVTSCVVLALAGPAHAALAVPAAPALVDDFADANQTTTGSARHLIDDQAMGSHSQGTVSCDHGILTVQGSLAPGRGVPAFMSLVLLVSPDGQPRDVSAFHGIRLRVKVNKGTLSVQAGSSAIENYDFHSSPLPAGTGEFQELRIPFKEMKRAWSEQTPLDLQTVISVNLVAFGMARSDFSYAVDEVGFY